VTRHRPSPPDPFGYEYFDDPRGEGYRGYHRTATGEGAPQPWLAARDFCRDHDIRTAVDVGCAKGFLVAELLAAGVDAVGYDVSPYALSFTTGLPCHRADLRDGLPRSAEAVFVLGLLLYLTEAELPAVLADLRAHTTRFLLVSAYYAGEDQEVPDPLRRITRPYRWWRDALADAGFTFEHQGEFFDVHSV